ncbi:hypothetical protein NFJ02_22g48210 [Pycnococcus provasolii]
MGFLGGGKSARERTLPSYVNKIEEEEAAELIQKNYRGHKVRLENKKQQVAATKIQKKFRKTHEKNSNAKSGTSTTWRPPSIKKWWADMDEEKKLYASIAVSVVGLFLVGKKIDGDRKARKRRRRQRR